MASTECSTDCMVSLTTKSSGGSNPRISSRSGETFTGP